MIFDMGDLLDLLLSLLIKLRHQLLNEERKFNNNLSELLLRPLVKNKIEARVWLSAFAEKYCFIF